MKVICNKKVQIGMLLGGFTLILTLSYFHLWNTDIHVPLTGYRSDSVGVLLEASNYVRGGTYYNNVLTGAPYINQGNTIGGIRDSSVPQLLIVPLAKMLGSVEAAVNIHALLNIVALSICMYLCCLSLNIKPELSAIAAIAYSNMSYYVFYTQTLLLIYSYNFYIPFVCLILLKVVSGYSKEEIDIKENRKKYVCIAYACMFFTGINSAYYAFFVLILLAFAFLYALIHNRDIWAILMIAVSYVGVGIGILSYTILNNLKNKWSMNAGIEIVYYIVYIICVVIILAVLVLLTDKLYKFLTIKKVYIGLSFLMLICLAGIVVLKKYSSYMGEWGGRSIYDVELGATKIYNLFLPALNNIVDKINITLDSVVNLENADFGIMGPLVGIGYVYSICSLCRFSEKLSRRKTIVSACGYFNVLIILLSAKGGFSTVIAALVTTGIRGYNRTCIFTGIFSLIAAMYLVQNAIEKCKEKYNNQTIYKYGIQVCIWGGLLVFLMISIPTNFVYKEYFGLSAYSQRKEEYDDWQNYIGKIENEVPDGSMILELPMVVDSNYMAKLMTAGRAYELSIPAIVAKKTMWSYGSGRIVDDPVEQIDQMIIEAKKMGFAGIYIDTLMYEDDSYEDILEGLNNRLGKPIKCNKQRRYFYKL